MGAVTAFPGSLLSRKKPAIPDEYHAWKTDPSPARLDDLMKKLDPTIDKAITSYAAGEQSMKTKARLMTVDLLHNYDAKKGMALHSYLLQNLQSLHRVKADRDYVVHVPENVRFNKIKLAKANAEYLSENGKEPTVQELSDITSIPLKNIEKARIYRESMPTAAVSNDKGDPTFAKPRDFETIWSDYVYFDLDPIDKKIFEWTTGYGSTPIISKGEVAQKLGISGPAVSLRINKIVKKMQEGAEYGV